MSDIAHPSAKAPRVLHELTPSKPVIYHQLCEKCRHIVRTSKRLRDLEKGIRLWEGSEEFQHHDTFDDLAQSAFDGCHLCNILHGRMPSDIKRQLSYVVGIYGNRIFFWQNEVSHHVASLYHGYSNQKIAGESDTLVNVTLLQSYGTDSLESFTQAKTWLQTCLDDHEACNVRKPSSPLIRLVEIAVSGTEISLRLREAPFTETGKEEPYFTLSHCWGGKVPLRLLQQNHVSFTECIPVEDLPQTFWDAVLIVSRLGYRYLWIDSLCIIQDSKLDWDEQVVIMGTIYRNSLCTIAPIHAEDSSQGCFVARNPLALSICKIGNSCSSKPCWDAGPNSRDPTPPLHRRAWVVQERALSPRTLYYGADMICWECIQSSASEHQPEMRSVWGDREPTNDNLKALFQYLITNFNHENYSRWNKHWTSLLELYTKCEATESKDRWPAIAGLAAEVQHHSGMKLFHGLWKDHLPEQLLWSCSEHDPEKPIMVSDTKGIPSWSWISVGGGVGWDGTDYDISWMIEILRLTATAIIMECPIIRISEISVGNIDENDWISKSTAKDRSPNVSDITAFPDDDRLKADEMWALQICRQEALYDIIQFFGLIVQQNSEDPSLWSRVGYFYMWWDPEDFPGREPPLCFGEKRQITLI